MTTQKFNFTKKALESLEAIPGKQAYYYDSKTSSLTLRVSPKGVKTFVLYKRVGTKPEKITLGRFPALTIEQARGKANEANAKIAQGQNPNDQRRALREEMTLVELFETYLERHAKIHKRSWKEDQEQFNRYLQKWKNRKISEIKKSDVQKLHTEIGNNSGKYAANRLLALLHTLFNKASDYTNWTNPNPNPNPAHGIKKFREESRERFMDGNEIPRFFEALGKEPNDIVRNYFLLLLLTGARRTNVLEMQWDQIDFEKKEWYVPLTKNGSSQNIPLLEDAIEILKEHHENTEGPWVFPGCGETGHLVEPKKAWKRILERANISDLKIHDIRRTLGSWQAATGASLSIIGKSLGHKNVSTTAIYARLSQDPVRESMNKAYEAMKDTLNAKKPNVDESTRNEQ